MCIFEKYRWLWLECQGAVEGGSFRAKNPVSGITKARQYVAMVVELTVQNGGKYRDIRMR
jgi:hypothetical protein